MKSKLKVGEYIRTYDGYIRKVRFVDDTSIISLDKDILEKVDGYDEYIIINLIEITDIKKHSFNIMDLIEEGDYVNEIYVEKK